MGETAPRPLLGLFAGIAAGVVASAAMAAFQAAAARRVPSDNDADPATVQAADRVSKAATGQPVPDPHRAAAGQAVRYCVGATLGGIYGVLAEYRPATRRGFGGAYGLVTSLLVDETAASVPHPGKRPLPATAPASLRTWSTASRWKPPAPSSPAAAEAIRLERFSISLHRSRSWRRSWRIRRASRGRGCGR